MYSEKSEDMNIEQGKKNIEEGYRKKRMKEKGKNKARKYT